MYEVYILCFTLHTLIYYFVHLVLLAFFTSRALAIIILNCIFPQLTLCAALEITYLLSFLLSFCSKILSDFLFYILVY